MRLKARSLAVLCSGSGSNFEALVQAQKSGRLSPAKIRLMVCNRPEAAALVRANRLKVPAALLESASFASREAYDAALTALLCKFGVDGIVLAGFMRILTPALLGPFRGRVINIHPSLLPAFRGAHGVRDAIAAGVRVTGVTVHLVTEELDGGPIIAQEAVAVKPKDTEKTLAERIHRVEHRLYSQAVRWWAQGKLELSGNKIHIHS